MTEATDNKKNRPFFSIQRLKNLVERMQNRKELNQLKEDKVYYKEQIKENAARLNELKTNNDNLEKFAREQYLMKKDNEDVFVIVEE
jgi:cell division protein FtsB